MLAQHEAPTMMVVNIKGGNHKIYEYSACAMADLKVQTGQSYFATNVCFQLATTIWYRQEKYSILRNQCLLSTSHYDLVWTRKV